MYPATRIVPSVPFYGKISLVATTANTSNTITVPSAVVPGDLVFMFAGGFDAGVSTNPGVVSTPSNVFTDSSAGNSALAYIDSSTSKPLLLTYTFDGTSGSDESEGYLGWCNFLTGGTAIPTYNGASGDFSVLFAFGIRNSSGGSENKKITVVEHASTSYTINTSTTSFEELEFKFVDGSNPQTSYHNLMNRTTASDELMLLLVASGVSDGNATDTFQLLRSPYPPGENPSFTEIPGAFAESNPSGGFANESYNMSNDFDGSISPGGGGYAPSIFYKFVYPGQKFPQYIYKVNPGGQPPLIAFSRMVLKIK